MPLKLYVYAAIAAALALLLWHDHRLATHLRTAKAEAAQATANLTALQTAYAHERMIATEASNDYERRLQALNVARADTPVRSVRLCRAPGPAVPATSAAASGTDAAGDAGHASEVGQDLEAGPDIGVALYALADEKDQQLAMCAALQGWVPKR